jgi:CTP:molybdopterin cytidylyltransferase MocA
MRMNISNIYPIILAAGKWTRAGFTQAEAMAARKIGLRMAVENCASLARPIVVLGCAAAALRGEVRSRARVVVNQSWRAGQLRSMLAGLRCVPRHAPFLLYPANLVFLTPRLVERMAVAFIQRARHHEILMPRFRGSPGHPVIFSAKVRNELQHAQTAREVVYRDPARVFYLPAATDAIWRDLQTPAELAAFCARGIKN